MKKAHDAKIGSNNDRYADNDEFHYLCQVADITSGNSKSFSIKSKKEPKVEIAVFNVQEKYYVISNICKHVGGPLSQGTVKEKIVTCPWHGWKYSIIDGKSPHEGKVMFIIHYHIPFSFLSVIIKIFNANDDSSPIILIG